MAALLTGPERHHRQQPRPADPCPSIRQIRRISRIRRIENNVRPATLRGQLRPYPLRRQHRAAVEAGGPGAAHRAFGDLFVAFRLEDFESDRSAWSDRSDGWIRRHSPQCPPAVRLLAQPERPHQRNLRPAVGRLAPHRPRPEVGNRCGAIWILRVELGQFFFRTLLDLPAHAPQFLSQFRSVAGDVLQHDLEDQAGNRVQVAGKGLAAEPQGFQGNRAAAGEGVHHQRRLVTMRRLDQFPRGLNPVLVVSHVPVGKLGDEVE